MPVRVTTGMIVQFLNEYVDLMQLEVGNMNKAIERAAQDGLPETGKAAQKAIKELETKVAQVEGALEDMEVRVIVLVPQTGFYSVRVKEAEP